MKQLQKIFLQGLVTFLPVALTIYIVYAGIAIVDRNAHGMTVDSFRCAHDLDGIGRAHGGAGEVDERR